MALKESVDACCDRAQGSLLLSSRCVPVWWVQKRGDALPLYWALMRLPPPHCTATWQQGFEWIFFW